jgi:hypothetical protein
MNIKLIIIGLVILLLPPITAHITAHLIAFGVGLIFVLVGVFWREA